jgi:isopenicillin N synthase-like dioxygenase
MPEEVRAKLSEPLSGMVKNTQQTLFRVLHYPPLKGKIEKGAVRSAPHEDINLITLLPAATETGLEVQDVKGNWHQVSTEPGTIVVNAGDMLQEASEGYYKSTTHRVVNPKGEAALKSRYSAPLFVHPRPEVVLSPRYTAATYLDQRLKEIGLK